MYQTKTGNKKLPRPGWTGSGDPGNIQGRMALRRFLLEHFRLCPRHGNQMRYRGRQRRCFIVLLRLRRLFRFGCHRPSGVFQSSDLLFQTKFVFFERFDLERIVPRAQLQQQDVGVDCFVLFLQFNQMIFDAHWWLSLDSSTVC